MTDRPTDMRFHREVKLLIIIRVFIDDLVLAIKITMLNIKKTILLA